MSTMLGKDMCFGFAMLAGGQELGTLIFILSFRVQTIGYSPWGSKNRISSKNSCK